MSVSSKSALLCLITSVVLSGCQSVAEKPSNSDPRGPVAPQSQSSITPDKTVSQSATKAPTQARPVADLWQLTRQNMSLPSHLDQPRVKAQLNWYKKHPDYMGRVVKRATPYYHYILNETLKRGMPAELALLPIVESAFDPFAYSHGRAAGPWQFIPSTGKHFGLTQNWWYDGRRDITRSTDAALDYLQQLNRRFDGDWLLALAAYNAGGGNVSLAIKRNKRKNLATDYWSLKLPKETMAYVPKLLAVSELFRNAGQYGLNLNPLPDQPYFAQVDTGSQIDIAQAASMAGISTKEMYLLNPGFNRWATAPEGPHSLLVPVAKAEQFRSALRELPVESRIKWARYTIKPGDSLISIAKKHNTTVDQIRNSNKLHGNSIRAGKTLLIATASKQSSEYVLSQHQRHADRQKSIARSTNRTEQYHRVKSGESFWSIARKYKVGVRQLARWNSMAPGDPLSVGKRLVIWSQPATPALNSEERQIIRKVGYRVRNGDSLYRIADRFNINVADIQRWNKLDKSVYLQPGQRLTLYVDVTRSP
ncbi:LysM peptidoglycan-binding domain-containing protein [Neptuniibacter halophilus]|uniref:LysM peptidoglycan-binding domain-containing protein n=1 Tax=Neptuniibacter halophilus TaxID=651666 RepID=UPI002573A8FE|nr:LysM peptidoglycan-binding domain-containing protein [Neptuniibacter halophilus]